jgi:hypothetical protein
LSRSWSGFESLRHSRSKGGEDRPGRLHRGAVGRVLTARQGETRPTVLGTPPLRSRGRTSPNVAALSCSVRVRPELGSGRRPSSGKSRVCHETGRGPCARAARASDDILLA